MVITNVNQVVYQGDGATTSWPFTFRIIDNTDIKLTLIDADGTETAITSDYYVDMVNNTVYYPGYAPGAEPPEADQPEKVQSGQRLVVYRELPITQEKDLGEKWPFNVIELGLDKLTMILQQIYGWWGRCLKFGVGWTVDHPDFDTSIPIEAGKTWRVNDEGTGFVASNSSEEAMSVANDAKDTADAAADAIAGAVEAANDAKETADGIAGTAQSALETAQDAKETADDAEEKATLALERVGNETYWYTNVDELKNADITVGSIAVTQGYKSSNDGGGAVYSIVSSAGANANENVVALDNGRYAVKLQFSEALSGINATDMVQNLEYEITNLASSANAAFYRSHISPQGIAYLNVNGQDKVYLNIRVDTLGSSAYAYNQSRIVEYNVFEDGTATMVSYTEPLSTGHGQGFGAKIENGEIYFYMMETGVPDRYLSSGANFGKGFTRVHYKGASTTNDDIVSYRLLPFMKNDKWFGKYKDVRFCTPNLDRSGKRIILKTAGYIFVYDLQKVLAVTTPDVDYTWQDAGTGSKPYDEAEYGYAPVSTRIDASAVQPLIVFPIAANTNVSQQGVACDDEYIYVASGNGNIAIPHCVEVYDYVGNKIKDIWYSGFRSLYTQSDILGGTNSVQQIVTLENEGIFLKNGEIHVLEICNRYSFGDVVEFNGHNYACISSNTGHQPDLTDEGYWQPSNHGMTKGTWNSSTEYTGAGSGDRQWPLRRGIFRIGRTRGKSSERALSRNAPVNAAINSASPGLTIGKGRIFSIAGADRASESKLPMMEAGAGTFRIYGMDGVSHLRFSNNTNIASQREYTIMRMYGSTTNGSAGIRFYSPDDSVHPGETWYIDKNGSTLKFDNFIPKTVTVSVPSTLPTGVTSAAASACRTGRVVQVNTDFTLSGSSSDWVTIATGLPAPFTNYYNAVNTWESSYVRNARITVTQSGNLNIRYGGAGTYSISFCYIASSE